MLEAACSVVDLQPHVLDTDRDGACLRTKWLSGAQGRSHRLPALRRTWCRKPDSSMRLGCSSAVLTSYALDKARTCSCAACLRRRAPRGLSAAGSVASSSRGPATAARAPAPAPPASHRPRRSVARRIGSYQRELSGSSDILDVPSASLPPRRHGGKAQPDRLCRH